MQLQLTLVESYSSNCARAASIVQLIAACVTLAVSIAITIFHTADTSYSDLTYIAGSGIWCPTLVIITVIVGFCAAATKRRKLIVCHMAMAIVTTVLTFAMLCIAVAALVLILGWVREFEEDITIRFLRDYFEEILRRNRLLSIVWVLASLVVFVASIWSSCVDCQAICCSTATNERSVQYMANGELVDVVNNKGKILYWDHRAPRTIDRT